MSKKRDWAFHGVADPNLLTEDLLNLDANELKDCLPTNRFSEKQFKEFYEEVLDALCAFDAGRNVQKEVSISALRADLRKLSSSICKFQMDLEALPNAAANVLQNGSGKSIKQLSESAAALMKSIDSGSELANCYSSKKLDYPILILAAHIAFVLGEKLGIEANTARSGTFASLISFLLDEIGVPSENPHSLVERALRVNVSRDFQGLLVIDTTPLIR